MKKCGILQLGSNNLYIQWLACHAISASVELLVVYLATFQELLGSGVSQGSQTEPFGLLE